MTEPVIKTAPSSDLEEMARQMRAFQDLTRELDAIIDSSSDGLWICDAEARVIRINPASERINNIKASEVVGKNMRELLDEGFIDRSAALEAITTKKVVSQLQNREGRKLISTGTPVLDANGEVIRVVVSERDITEIDNLQRELEEQEALRDQFRNHMLELQQADVASKSVVARSPLMVNALKQALKVSTVNSAVLILGESGVGKGLVAELIHKNSTRADKPLIEINCGAIPESLIESELFGYEKGAFTGAQAAGKPGYLELADGGILFLDEIAELPQSAQVKLLRFLENGKVVRLGGTKARHLDVRILAATHRNLDEMVRQGSFRLDLYYRLNVIPINVPALRERRDCILPLVRHYLELFGARDSIRKRLTRSASDALLAYDYPGNVRQLMNVCERLVVMAETDLIDVKDLPAEISAGAGKPTAVAGGWQEDVPLQETLDQVEKAVLEKALAKHRNQMRMAEVLGVNQSTIARKLRKYGLKPN
ncbi:sigma-54 interaction domain-containing protein [Citrifermentans bremense]|uniref:sigma-54 interaction domain-containing protein n=1 Tax=Citrifermentans bremense TaxID=60035 RepID=UPI000404551C|nr:sigma-54-dependent Fis family transcriptional regulator [Citrifermentans bremense]